MKLPRPLKKRSSLDPETLAGFDALAAAARRSASALLPLADLGHLTGISASRLPSLIASLTATRHIIAGRNRIAVIPVVSAKLHAEKCANRKRRAAGKPRAWPHREAILGTFPGLAATPGNHRPASYKTPKAFAALFPLYEHHHRTRTPADVEPITEPYHPGELQSLITALYEQTSATRKPILLYTRKSVQIALRRQPKTMQ